MEYLRRSLPNNSEHKSFDACDSKMVAQRLCLVLKYRLHNKDDVFDKLGVHVCHDHLQTIQYNNVYFRRTTQPTL